MEENIFTVVIVICTITITIIGYVNLEQNKKLLQRMKVDSEYNMTPFVVCYADPDYESDHAMFYCVVHNQGKGPCKNIKLKLTCNSDILKGKNKFEYQIHSLGPDGKEKINMGVLCLGENKTDVNAEMSYRDLFDKEYSDENIISLSGLFGY